MLRRGAAGIPQRKPPPKQQNESMVVQTTIDQDWEEVDRFVTQQQNESDNARWMVESDAIAQALDQEDRTAKEKLAEEAEARKVDVREFLAAHGLSDEAYDWELDAGDITKDQMQSVMKIANIDCLSPINSDDEVVFAELFTDSPDMLQLLKTAKENQL
ncbi:MAG: uncharacterized protein KVP18_002616 [Porospora cf. gigantea A]|uniref:uncharacterized protein n=1 Tax=Porospora cf. gigantea A TaxID=2853593 RepID=UPI003559D819|nr:MAG: hypothetical protein KVP18_002616 [Porospora cf. gigantea A]